MAAQNAGVSVSFSRLATSASESIVGFLSDGSPLKSLLDQLPGLAGQAVATALTDAIIRGQNPTRTASQIRAALGGNMNRALTIARTETMRAYREASHRTLTQNGDILQGWVWVASFSRRTCASCLALAGSVHRLEERMESHPRCRCSQAPLIRGQKVEFEKGEDWFRRQDATTQRDILGSNIALQAYRRGDATLLDFVGRHRSEFRIDRRLRALVGGHRMPLHEQVERGFPFLPAGCHMALDPVARDIVLDNLRNGITSSFARRVAALREQARADPGLRLNGFLASNGLDLDDVYDGQRGWSVLRAEAGLQMLPEGPQETALRRACGVSAAVTRLLSAGTRELARRSPISA